MHFSPGGLQRELISAYWEVQVERGRVVTAALAYQPEREGD